MKKLIFALVASMCAPIFAEYDVIDVGLAPAPVCGKVVAFDAASTNTGDVVAFKQIRALRTYKDVASIATSVYTNSTSVFNHSNNTWVATNIVTTTTTTNIVKTLDFEKVTTNAIISVVCNGNFGTSNAVNAVWFFDGDMILIENANKAKARIVVEK